MKSKNVKWLVGLVAVALVVIAIALSATSANAASKWTVDPSLVTAADFCDDTDVHRWYQAQHFDDEAGKANFIGSTVACSGWAAVWQIALIHGYASVDAAALDGWAVGNANLPWVASLPNISEYAE